MSELRVIVSMKRTDAHGEVETLRLFTFVEARKYGAMKKWLEPDVEVTGVELDNTGPATIGWKQYGTFENETNWKP